VETTSSKPSLSLDQAARQLIRDLDSAFLPSYPSALSLTYAYRATDAAPAIPKGLSSWIGSGFDASAGGFQRYTAAQITNFDNWVKLIEDVANIKVTRVGAGASGEAAYSDNAQVLLGNFTTGATTSFSSGFATYIFSRTNDVYTRAGYVALNGAETYNTAPTLQNFGFSTAIHEFLHVLGLSHPGDYNAGANSPTYAANAGYLQDSSQYTLMSYFSERETGANFRGLFGMTPLLHDIAALQKLYGANLATRTGDSVYGFNSNTGLDSFSLTSNASTRVFTIWDAGGDDTLDLSGYSSASKISLEQATFSSAGTRGNGLALISNISIASGAVIENAIGGAGADEIIGNAAANKLWGNSGNDKIKGGAGNDQIDGGAGLDSAIYTTSFASATIVTRSNGASVTTAADGADTLTSIERLSFTDRVVALDVGAGQNAGIAYRLYQAAFARTPDLSGLTFWTNSLDTAKFTTQEVAGGFVNSPEFKSVYGQSPSAEQIVDRFYRNVLGRQGETEGTTFWVGLINSGNPVSVVLAGFSESPENQARLLPIIGQGVTLDGSLLA